jgi:Xaa-Pro aminopeptidase
VHTLPAIDHAARCREAGELLRAGGDDAAGLDAVLYTDLTDVRWLTGFTGSNGWAVVRGDDVVLGTDGRYDERARAETAGTGVTVVVETQPQRLHQRLLDALAGAAAVGLDSTSVSHHQWTRLAGDVAVRHADSDVKERRTVKDAAELARIEIAAGAADAALADVEEALLADPGRDVTEAAVRDELEYRMRLHGADDRSYATIVASGPDHAARPHHEVARRRLCAGDTLIIDVGALVDGYHSDMTRSYVVGRPSAEQVELYGLVAAAQRAGLDALRPGVAARDVDQACRRVFADAGVEDWFVHGTGHGVGLEIHESPFLSASSDAVVRAGSVVTVEPGLYRGGFGGFRIEDLVVVTDEGPRVLTHAPQHPPHDRP